MSENFTTKVITIDGPVASGKSTVSLELARRLGFNWVSTGMFYRGVAYLVQKSGCGPKPSQEEVLASMENVDWKVKPSTEMTKLIVEGCDVTGEVLNESLGQIASYISKFPKIRHALLKPQRDLAKGILGLVAEGRDCGTIIFPQADVKIYLTADSKQRARRRAKEEGELAKVAKAQAERDKQDSSRKVAPLVAPKGAYVVNGGDMEFLEVVTKIEKYARKVLQI